MDQPFETVTLVFERGSMTGSEIQAILDEVLAELGDPASEVSRESAELEVSVDSLKVDEKSGVLPLAIAIALAVTVSRGGAVRGRGRALFQRGDQAADRQTQGRWDRRADRGGQERSSGLTAFTG